MTDLTGAKKAATSQTACVKAALIYEYTYISANSLWNGYELARASRGTPRGIATHQEQDLAPGYASHGVIRTGFYA